MQDTCFFCRQLYQNGPGVYGHYLKRYDVTACRSCYDNNWDGWHPRIEPLLLAHLKQNGAPIPERNEKGWLPRE